MGNYARNLKVATNKAANICGVDTAEVRAFYRKVKDCTNPPIIIAHYKSKP